MFRLLAVHGHLPAVGVAYVGEGEGLVQVRQIEHLQTQIKEVGAKVTNIH